MSKMLQYHRKSMDFVAQATMPLHAENIDDEGKNDLLRQAFNWELQAIQELEKQRYHEPTYSVMHRSAATLALDCRDTRLAQQLATKALAENPPDDIAQELRQVLQQALDQNHRQTQAIHENVLADAPQPFDEQGE